MVIWYAHNQTCYGTIQRRCCIVLNHFNHGYTVVSKCATSHPVTLRLTRFTWLHENMTPCQVSRTYHWRILHIPIVRSNILIRLYISLSNKSILWTAIVYYKKINLHLREHPCAAFPLDRILLYLRLNGSWRVGLLLVPLGNEALVKQQKRFHWSS